MDKYAVIIEKTEDGGFGAYSPDLPGCVATGKTMDEVEQRMLNAMQGHIEQFVLDGRPVPAPRRAVAYMVTFLPSQPSGSVA
jgi:predicted RNase H-like HicB family nuclease